MDICIFIDREFKLKLFFFSRNFQPIEVHQFYSKRKQNVKYMKF